MNESKPLTMTEQRKADIEHAIDHPSQADMDGEMHTLACNLWDEAEALRAALAAAEAALADERRHADWMESVLAGMLTYCPPEVVKDDFAYDRLMAAFRHAADDCVNAHAARRAAEVANG